MTGDGTDTEGGGDGTDGGDGPEYGTNFRKNPEEYEVGRGSEGVFKVQPYKDELLPLWSYADEKAAEESADAILDAFYGYLDKGDFVGADMARKYLRMGYTRSMRYAKYPGGKKYDEDGDEREPNEWADEEKHRAAVVFEDAWREAREDERYQQMRERHEQSHADG
mgnify:CR=1 FL=1